MNKGLLATISGFIGALVGSVTTYFVAKRINEKKRDEEVQSFIKEFKGETINLDEVEIEKPTEDEKAEYAEVIEKHDYATTSESNTKKPSSSKAKFGDKKESDKKSRVSRMFKPPYIIEDYEFEEENDYRKITLTFYADGKLVDEIGTNVEAATILGDTLKSFGDSASVLYVRNERLRCDYEVLKDDQSYSDAVEKRLYDEDDSDEDDE